MIGIEGLHQLIRALSQLDLAPAQQAALGAEAADLAGIVREQLSHAPGSDHATPWRRTGQLHDSIVSDADPTQAVVGSNDPVAIYQELGTGAVPPRPFLAPAGAAHADDNAHNIASAIVAALREALR